MLSVDVADGIAGLLQCWASATIGYPGFLGHIAYGPGKCMGRKCSGNFARDACLALLMITRVDWLMLAMRPCTWNLIRSLEHSCCVLCLQPVCCHNAVTSGAHNELLHPVLFSELSGALHLYDDHLYSFLLGPDQFGLGRQYAP